MTQEASGGAGGAGKPPGPRGPRPGAAGGAPLAGEPAAGQGAELPIGRYLASQRRLRGITLDDLAARTRIPRRSLERLEAGAFDAQPDGFVRGFVRTVAEALGLDPHEAVMRLVQEPRAADEEARRGHRLWVLLAAGALAAGVLTLGAAALRLAVGWLAESEPDASAVPVYRHDAVRALAEERGEGRDGQHRGPGAGPAAAPESPRTPQQPEAAAAPDPRAPGAGSR